MADVKWIKLMIDVFENRKIRQIEAMPEGDGIIIIWFKLLCLAGNINNDGLIYFTNEIPFTDEMLSTEFGKSLNTVRLALSVFERFGMLEIVDNIYRVSNWEKYQNIETLDKIREQTRKRVAVHREKQKFIESARNVTCNVSVTHGNAIEEEGEEERDKERDKDIILHPGVTNNSGTESIISLILNDKKEYGITEKQIQEWSDLYPAVDILTELRKMKGWLNSNPKKRKTKRGILNFITTWLSREQDKGNRRDTGQIKRPSNVGNFEGRQYDPDYYKNLEEDLSKYTGGSQK